MANYSMVHDRISKGRGKAAVRVGQPFVVHRLTPFGFADLAKPIYCLLRRMSGGPHIEQKFFVSQVFEMVTDVRYLLIGDILEERLESKHSQKPFDLTVSDNDPNLVGVSLSQKWGPMYLLTQTRPVHKFIGVRVELMCQVRRGTFPDTDGDSGYQEQGENAEDALMLTRGDFSFRAIADKRAIDSIALIPFQLEPYRVGSNTPFDLPIDWMLNKWNFLCPGNWPGLRLRENDHIIHPDGNRFRVHSIFESHIGPEVLQGIAEKLES